MTNDNEISEPTTEEAENSPEYMDEDEIKADIVESPVQQTDDEESESEDVVTFKRSQLYTVLLLMYALLLPLVLVAGLAVGYFLWGPGNESVNTRAAEIQPTSAQPQPTAAQAESSAPEVPSEITRYDVPIDDDPIFGPEDAAITIIEFSDYECPYCRRWHQEVLPLLIEEYPDQLRFVYRDFPLTSIHSNAVPAAIAANCAGEQDADAYWTYNERLFSMDLGLGAEAYQEYASEIGLDTDAFEECLDSNRYEEEVMADFEYASQLGVRSTPTFFINGIALVGAQPYEVFKQVIEQELAGELD
jgi:protein-disulfide isomerase